MAGETPITIVGNCVADPELRFTPSGAAVANFTVASTPRTFDKDSSEWKDGDPMFLRCSVWRQAAENVAESLTKGMRVLVQGRLKSRSYEANDGSGKRTVFEVDVDEVGPALKYATAKVTRTPSGGGGGAGQSYGGGGGGGQSYGGGGGGGGQDPWATGGGTPARAGGDPWATPQSGEPPFFTEPWMPIL